MGGEVSRKKSEEMPEYSLPAPTALCLTFRVPGLCGGCLGLGRRWRGDADIS